MAANAVTLREQAPSFFEAAKTALEKGTPPPHGIVFGSLGRRVVVFARRFSLLGHIVVPDGRRRLSLTRR